MGHIYPLIGAGVRGRLDLDSQFHLGERSSGGLLLHYMISTLRRRPQHESGGSLAERLWHEYGRHESGIFRVSSNIDLPVSAANLGVTMANLRGPEGEEDFQDNVSYLRGKHAFKFGFEYVDVVRVSDNYSGGSGLIKFASLQNFLQGIREHWFGYFSR